MSIQTTHPQGTPVSPAPLPGAPHLHYAGGVLHIEQVRLADLARQYGTPLFVYSQASILAALSAYQRGLRRAAMR
jgi:diaminopimelate decarboxylase